MSYFCGIIPSLKYNPSFKGTNQTAENPNVSTSVSQYSEKLSDIPTDKVGTTSTKVARKSVKYIWKKFTKSMEELFNKNETLAEGSEKLHEVAENVQNAITMSGKAIANAATPKYDYEA